MGNDDDTYPRWALRDDLEYARELKSVKDAIGLVVDVIRAILWCWR